MIRKESTFVNVKGIDENAAYYESCSRHLLFDPRGPRE